MQGLRPRPTLESSIGTGFKATLPVNKMVRLSDDPRVLHYANMSVGEWRELGLKLAMARRYQDEVRFAAIKADRTLGMHMAVTGVPGQSRIPGVNKGPIPENEVVGEHDAKIEESLAREEIEREDAIEEHKLVSFHCL